MGVYGAAIRLSLSAPGPRQGGALTWRPGQPGGQQVLPCRRVRGARIQSQSHSHRGGYDMLPVEVRAQEGEFMYQSCAHPGRPGVPVVLEDLCFQAQQAAEKAIKAVCRSRSLEHGFTHDLGELTDLLDEDGVQIPVEVDNAVILNRYAVQTRYPGLYPPLTEADWVEAIDLAKGVVGWASLVTGYVAGVDLNDLASGVRQIEP